MRKSTTPVSESIPVTQNSAYYVPNTPGFCTCSSMSRAAPSRVLEGHSPAARHRPPLTTTKENPWSRQEPLQRLFSEFVRVRKSAATSSIRGASHSYKSAAWSMTVVDSSELGTKSNQLTAHSSIQVAPHGCRYDREWTGRANWI